MTEVTPSALAASGAATYTPISATRAGGTSVVSFALPYTDSCGAQELAVCRDVATNFLLAHGAGDAFKGAGIHPSGGYVGLGTLVSEAGGGGLIYPSLDSKYVLHAVLMWLAWLVLAPAGSLIARFGKKLEAKVGGKPLWFAAHRVLMPTAAALTLGGFVTAVVMVGSENRAATTHAAMGYVVFCLAMLQPFNAVLRPHPGERWRQAWECLHKGQGHALWILGLWTGVLGGAKLDERRMLSGDFDNEDGCYHGALALAVLWTVAFVLLLAKQLLTPATESADPEAEAPAKPTLDTSRMA